MCPLTWCKAVSDKSDVMVGNDYASDNDFFLELSILHPCAVERPDVRSQHAFTLY